MSSQLTSGSTAPLWTYIKTGTCTGQTSLDITSLPAYEQYMIIGYVDSMSVASQLYFLINNLVGTAYSYSYVSGGTASGAQTGKAHIVSNYIPTTEKSFICITVMGKSPAVASGVITGSTDGGYNGNTGGFNVIMGNAVQMTSIKFQTESASTFNAKLEVFGRNSQ